jgi:hypothetical protein
MAGRRMLYDTSGSEKLAMVSDSAALLWLLMLPHTDVQGNLEANPKLIKGRVVPLRDSATPASIGLWLEELANARSNGSPYGLIAFYEDHGKRFLHFINFLDYQKLDQGRKPNPEFPNHPTELDEGSPGEPRLFDKNGPPNVRSTEEKNSQSIVIPAAPLAFNGRLMKLTAEEHAAIKARFQEFLEPELYVIYNKIDEWCGKNGKRGQKRDWHKTAANWIAKEDIPGHKSGPAPLPAGSVQAQIDEERRKRAAL